jgi:hypothetical protein
MATASFTPNTGLPLAHPAVSILIARYQGQILPNLRLLSLKYEEGPESGQAVFRYVFDDGGAVDTLNQWPDQPEEVFGPNATGPFVVQPDDQILCYEVDDTGGLTVIFDGFAAIPTANYSSLHERLNATFVAQATPGASGTPISTRVPIPRISRASIDRSVSTARGWPTRLRREQTARSGSRVFPSRALSSWTNCSHRTSRSPR